MKAAGSPLQNQSFKRGDPEGRAKYKSPKYIGLNY